MNAKVISGLMVVGLAGLAMGEEPILLEPSVGAVRHAGYIYFNIATGEKITTLIDSGDDQRRTTGEAGDEIWVATTRAQCAEFGYETEYFFAIDDTTGAYTMGHGGVLFDWGDIPMDTVVDCVQIHWVTDHADSDTNSDGIADGVEGFAATWTYWDAFTGRAADFQCLSLPLISFRLSSLLGEYPVVPFELAMWTADIDLAASFGTSLTFEIGDTDGDPQEAAVHHPNLDDQDWDSDSIPDVDPDEDGLADWGWSIQFIQPGTVDLDNADNDSDIYTGRDGDSLAFGSAGVVFGSPTPGHPEYDSLEDSWAWVSDGPTAGATEDAFSLGVTEFPDGSGSIDIAGTFWFGGLNCDAGQAFGYTPATHFQTVLYGPGGVCAPDLNRDGRLDFFDVSYFLNNRVNYDGDGVFDFFDVSMYLAAFSAGCS